VVLAALPARQRADAVEQKFVKAFYKLTVALEFIGQSPSRPSRGSVITWVKGRRSLAQRTLDAAKGNMLAYGGERDSSPPYKRILCCIFRRSSTVVNNGCNPFHATRSEADHRARETPASLGS
jgi:hypothetical protein